MPIIRPSDVRLPLPTEEEQAQRRQLDLTKGFAAQRNPDEAARILRVADEHGITFEAAEGLKGKLSVMPSWETLIRESPVLAERLSDPGRASVMQDDVENLKGWERWFGGITKVPGATISEAQRGNITRKLVAPNWKDLMREPLTPEELEERDSLRREMATLPEEELGYITGIIPSTVGMAPLMAQTLVRSVPYAAGGTAVGAGVGAVGGAAFGGVGAVPGAIGGAVFGGVVGFRVGTFVESGRAEAALAWDELSQDPNIDPEVARGAAFAIFVVNGGLEAIGIEAVFRIVPGLKKFAGVGGRKALRAVLADPVKQQALKKFAKHILTAGATEGITEALQELGPAFGHIASQRDTTFEQAIAKAWEQRGEIGERMLESGIKGAQAGVGGAGISATFSHMAGARRARERQAMWQVLGDTSRNSTLRERLPEAFRDYVDRVQKKYGAIESVQVPAAALTELFQTVDPPDSIKDAIARAGDAEVTIPLADFATYVAPLDGFDRLVPDIRVGDEPTLREAPEIEARAKKIVEAARGWEPGQSRDPVFDDVKKQLEAAGISPDAASKYAAWWSAFAEARASRNGTTAAEYYKTMNLTVGNSELVEDVIAGKSEILTPEQLSLVEQAGAKDPAAMDALMDTFAWDPLTGANGRAAWFNFQQRNEPGVYLSIDLNDFKRVNDTWGHGAGDETLRAVAQAIGPVIRENRGKFFRPGGDEFSAHFQDSQSARAAVASITRAMNEMPSLFEGKYRASISLGIGTEFKSADEAALRAKVRASAAGRSRGGTPDLAKGDVFAEGEVEELMQPFLLPPPPPKWASGVERAVESAKQQRGDAKSWLSILQKSAKKEEIEQLQVAKWLQEKEGTIQKEQVLAFVRENKLSLSEEWLGRWTRPNTEEEIERHQEAMKKWEEEHAEWEDAREEWQRQVDEGEIEPGLSDDARDELEEELRGEFGISVSRRGSRRYNYFIMGRESQESNDLDEILVHIYENEGLINRQSRDQIQNLSQTMHDRWESPEDYFELEHGFDWSDYKDLDTEEQAEWAEEIDERLDEIDEEVERLESDEPLLIPRSEDEVSAAQRKISKLLDEKERLEYERKLVTHEIEPEVDIDQIEEYAREIEELSEGSITVRVNVAGEASYSGRVDVEVEIEGRDNVLDQILEYRGSRSRDRVEEIMGKLEDDEADSGPEEPERPQLPEHVSENTLKHGQYQLEGGRLAVKGTQRELLLIAPGEQQPNALAWTHGHWGQTRGVLAHARLAEHDFGDDKSHLMVEEIQSDRFQLAREIVQKWKQRLADLREGGTERQHQINLKGESAVEREIADLEAKIKEGPFASVEAIAERLQLDEMGFRDPVTGKTWPVKATENRDDPAFRERAAKQFAGELMDEGQVVPDAPFKGDAWVELSLKRLLLYAAEGGFDKLNWTTGDQQADRWSGALQEKVDRIEWTKRESGTYDLRYFKRGQQYTTQKAAGEGVAPDRLPNIFGGYVAGQITSSTEQSGVVEGDDIMVGGEGMRLYYDHKIPTILKKLTKQEPRLVEHPGLGAEDRVEFKGDPTDIKQALLVKINKRIEEMNQVIADFTENNNGELPDRLVNQRDYTSDARRMLLGDLPAPSNSVVFAVVSRSTSSINKDVVIEFEEMTGIPLGDHFEVVESREQVWEIDLPESIRAKIKQEGLPLFQRGKRGIEDYRGKTSFDEYRRHFQVTLTGKANLSTFIHESGHAFLEVLYRDAVAGHAQSRTDLDVIYEWLGAAPGALLDVEQKERWARGVEAYVREGRAPSTKLEAVFRAFKAWLMMIYASMRGLNVELTDEVRGVMDRLFATDAEIEAARADRALLPTELEGLTAAEESDYQQRWDKAINAARDSFEREALREMRRDLSAEFRQIREQVEEGAKSDPARNAWSLLASGETLDGREIPEVLRGRKLSREAVKEAKLGRKLAAVSEEGGVGPETAAPYLGFDSGAELLRALSDLVPLRRYVKEESERRMAEKYPGFRPEQEWYAEQAVRHLGSNEVNEMLWTEYVAVSKQVGAAPNRSAMRVLERAAERRVGEMSRIEMQPGVYDRAEKRAAREWTEAIKKKDFRAALSARRRQIWNRLVRKQLERALDEHESIRDHLKKFEDVKVRRRIGKAGPLYLDAIDKILEGIEFAKQTNKALARRASLASYIEKMEAEGDTVAIPAELRSELALKNYRTMTLDELRAVDAAVTNIESMARLKNRLYDGRQSRDFARTTAQLAEHIRANVGEDYAPDKPGSRQNPSWWDGKKAWFRSAHMTLTKIEFLARVLDGGQTAGWAHELIFEPFVKAQKEKLRLSREVTQRLFREVSLADRMRLDKEVDFLGYRLSVREVIALVLNLGNDGNKVRLLGGYANRAGWTEQAILERAGEILTDADLDLVQHIWDTIGSLKPLIAEVHQRATGLQPEWVQATPVTIGKRTLAGGYYPIVKDRARSHMGEAIAQRKTGEVWENNFMAPVAEAGFTKSRGRDLSPLLLSLDVVPAHINEVIHYVTHYEAVRAVDRLTMSRRVEAAIKNGIGNEAYNIIRPWLQAIAADGNIHENPDFIDRVFRRLRLGSSIALLGFKISTGLKQFLGLSGSAKEIGTKYVAIGAKIFAQRGFSEAAQFSTEISDIEFTQDRDITQMFERMTSGFSEFGYLKNRLAHFSLAWIMLNQKMVNAITWYGAREKALAEGHPDPERYAGAIVRMSQAGGGIKDTAAIQRVPEFKRTIVVMYTYFSVMFNQLFELMPKKKKKARQKMAIMAARWWWLVTAPVAIELMLSGREPDDGDEPEDWLSLFAVEQLLFASRTIPLAGSLLDAAISDRERRYGAWVDTMFKGTRAAARTIAEGGDVSEGTVKSLVDLLGAATAMPSGAAKNAYEYLSEYDHMDEPVRNLLFRSPSQFE